MPNPQRILTRRERIEARAGGTARSDLADAAGELCAFAVGRAVAAAAVQAAFDVVGCRRALDAEASDSHGAAVDGESALAECRAGGSWWCCGCGCGRGGCGRRRRT